MASTATEKLRKITDAFDGLYNIIDDRDLSKEDLTLSDFFECKRIMPLLGEPGKEAFTICEKAADYFKRKGFDVLELNAGFSISI